MFTFTFQAEDYFAKYTGLQGNEVLLPTGLFSLNEFQDCPTTVVGQPIPIVYGDRSASVSATAAPTFLGNPARDFYSSGGFWGAGFGNRVSVATPPTSIGLSDASGGTLNLLDVPGSRYYFMVTAIGSDGIESDPYVFNNQTGSPSFTIAANGRQITVTWSGGSGAVKYRCYLGAIYFGIRWLQYIETAGTSAVFDHQPNFPGVPTTPSTISTGASNVIYGSIYYYTVSAMMPDGETTRTAEVSAVYNNLGSDPPRPFYLQWNAVAGALSYRVYKRGTTGGFQWQFDVPAGTTQFTDDLTNATANVISGYPKRDGPVPCTYVGTCKDTTGTTFRRFVVCNHAVKEITTVFQNGAQVDPGNFGVTFYVPGKAGYAARFGPNTYVDINGKRFTCLYVLGPQGDAAADGSQPLRVTMKGVESAGDGSGTLLTDLADQYEHLLRNGILRPWTGTSWSTTGPTWGDSPVDVDIVDHATFLDVKTRWAVRVAGGCPGAFTVGVDENGSLKQESVNTWLARLNQSLDVRSGFSRKSQFMITMFWRDVSELPSAPSYSASLGINKGTFKITDRPESIENQITIQYALQPGQTEPWSSVAMQDVDSQNALGGEIKPRTISLWCTANAAVAWAIGDARLKRRRFGIREAEWESDMGALTDDLGTLATVTHPDGYGALGWLQQPTIFTRHEFDPQQLKVRVTAEDVYWIFDASVSATQPIPAGIGETFLGAGSVDLPGDYEALLAQERGAFFVHDPGDDWIAPRDPDLGDLMPQETLQDETVED